MATTTPGGAPELGLSGTALQELLDDRAAQRRRLDRLWRWYANPMTGHTGDGRPTFAQEEALPARLRKEGTPLAPAPEVIVENDIGWRVDAMVEFLVGGAIRVASGDSETDGLIEGIFRRSGGATMFQDWALQGAIFGTADLLVRAGDARLEVVPAIRATPIFDANDGARLAGYAISTGGEAPIVELWTNAWHRVWKGGRKVVEERNTLGEPPIAHAQNRRNLNGYDGQSEVEPLIPLQNELNTRLSDRANRVTMQSFRMYLAKGLGDLGGPGARIAPGQVWSTDNEAASIEAFGGDATSPSEEAHIKEIREALDKHSGVPPAAVGVIKTGLGQLSSATAIEITFTGLRKGTERKQETFGAALRTAVAMALRAMQGDEAPTAEALVVEWPAILPTSEADRLENALRKQTLGVDRAAILRELGYAPTTQDADE